MTILKINDKVRLKFSVLCELMRLCGDPVFISQTSGLVNDALRLGRVSVLRRWDKEFRVWLREMVSPEMRPQLKECFDAIDGFSTISDVEINMVEEILRRGNITSESEYRLLVMATASEVEPSVFLIEKNRYQACAAIALWETNRS